MGSSGGTSAADLARGSLQSADQELSMRGGVAADAQSGRGRLSVETGAGARAAEDKGLAASHHDRLLKGARR
jgi:hypothetical protein